RRTVCVRAGCGAAAPRGSVPAAGAGGGASGPRYPTGSPRGSGAPLQSATAAASCAAAASSTTPLLLLLRRAAFPTLRGSRPRRGYQLNGPSTKSVTRVTASVERGGVRSARTSSSWSRGASDTVV